MSDGSAPDGLPRFVFDDVDFAVGVFDAKFLVSQENGDAVEGVFMHGSDAMRFNSGMQHAHLRILKFDAVVLGIDLGGVEIAADGRGAPRPANGGRLGSKGDRRFLRLNVD